MTLPHRNKNVRREDQKEEGVFYKNKIQAAQVLEKVREDQSVLTSKQTFLISTVCVNFSLANPRDLMVFSGCETKSSFPEGSQNEIQHTLIDMKESEFGSCFSYENSEHSSKVRDTKTPQIFM